MTTRWRWAPRVKMRPAAMPAFMAISGVRAVVLVRPRMPSVPKYLRVMDCPGRGAVLPRFANKHLSFCPVTKGYGLLPGVLGGPLAAVGLQFFQHLEAFAQG